jgi:hypothetical protein
MIDLAFAAGDGRHCGDQPPVDLLVGKALEDLLEAFQTELLAKRLRRLGVHHRGITGDVRIA